MFAFVFIVGARIFFIGARIVFIMYSLFIGHNLMIVKVGDLPEMFHGDFLYQMYYNANPEYQYRRERT